MKLNKKQQNREIETILCAAFPGTGKTHYCNSYPEYMPQGFAIDSDSSKFDKKYFPDNYIKHIKDGIGIHAKIFISSHEEVRNALVDNGLEFTLVYPDVSLKDEYLNRYKERGSTEVFIKLLDKNWEVWLKQLHEQKGCNHIILKSNQFISNVM